MTPDRITLDPLQCGGRPYDRGMRIRVSDVIDLLASGLTPAQVVDELPDLELADVQACVTASAHEGRPKSTHPPGE